MFFYLKHRWQIALLATGVVGLLSWQFGAFTHLMASPWSLTAQIGVGLVAGILSLVCDGVLHEIFKRTLGQTYLEVFNHYGRMVLGRMRLPEYITGGLMAALAEEPLFRGTLLVAIDRGILGVAITGLLFAACHWLRREFLLFWFWAMLEGIWFGLLMIGTGSLLIPMIAHGLHDIVGYRVFQAMIRDRNFA